MKNLKDESGQVLAITVLGMFLLFGCIALAVDVSMLFRARRNVQIAADSAAIAAALAVQYPGPNTPTQAADAAAAANGVTDPTDVSVNTSPTDGYHTGAGYVEVKIIQPTPTFFINVFNAYYTHRNDGTVPVGARAVAGTTPGAICLYVLDNTKTDTDTLFTQGTVTATHCGVQVNSPNQSATCDHGSGKLNSPFLHIVGGQDTGGGCKLNQTTPVSTGVAPVPDPYKDLAGPIPPGDCATTNVGLDGSGNLTGNPAAPGVGKAACYSYFTTSKGKSTPAAVSVSAATLGAGVYVFETGVNITGAVTVNGGTIDVYGGSFNNQNGSLIITAPTTGTYNGIAIMQPALNTTSSCSDSSLKVTPCLQVQFGATVYLQDEGGGVQAAGIVAWDIYNKSDLKILDTYNDANPTTTPLTKVTLVE